MQKSKTIEEQQQLLRECSEKAQDWADALMLASTTISLLYDLQSLPDCNDCMRQGCAYRPMVGEHTRINCPLHMDSAV